MTEPTTPQAAVQEALRMAQRLKSICRRRDDIRCGLLTARACEKIEAERDALIDSLAALAQQRLEPAAVEVSRLAARDVLVERQRQISKEGWTPEHDDEHDEGGLSLAGAVYAITKGPRTDVPPAWPWEAAAFKPRDWRANLVRAGALVLAEIERLDRLKSARCIEPMCACRGGPCAECPEGRDIALATTASPEVMLNGLTEAETTASASVQGLSGAGRLASGGEVDIEEMVNRFLSWKLPSDFSPDCGITFKRIYNETSPFGPQNHEPTGTNLLSGIQARQMVEHIAGRTGKSLSEQQSIGLANDLPGVGDCISGNAAIAFARGIEALAATQASPTSAVERETGEAMGEMIGWRDRAYVDSTPQLHVGDSAFEDWFQAQPFATQSGVKQISRDSYAAGMGDPLVIARATPTASTPAEPMKAVAWMHPDGRVIRHSTIVRAHLDGGATLSSARGYTIPLYTHPSASTSAAQPLLPDYKIHELARDNGDESDTGFCFNKGDWMSVSTFAEDIQRACAEKWGIPLAGAGEAT